MIIRMATKQPKVLIPLQLILILIALYGVRQPLHCKSVTDIDILTTNLAECVCVCAKCDPFLPLRFHFFFKLPEFFFRIAKFPYAAFGPLFAFHCPIFLRKTIL